MKGPRKDQVRIVPNEQTIVSGFRKERRMEPMRLLPRYFLVAACLASSGAFALEIPTGNADFKLNISVLAQPRIAEIWDGDPPTASQIAGSGDFASPNGTLDTEYYLRRARIYITGSAFKKFTWYLMTDQPNFGIRGNYTARVLVQDVHIGYVPVQDVDIEMGFLYMPLTHLALNSSAATSALEKGTAILFYNNAQGLRETGVQARALLFDRRIAIRGGFYEGLHTDATQRVNPNGRPLVAGHLRFNLIGSETGYAYPTLYMDGKSRASIGVGAQFQTKGSPTPITTVNAAGARITANTAVNDYLAYAADVFVDFALPGDTEVAFQGDVYRWDWGTGSDKTGWGTTYELGYRWGPIEPQINGYYFNSDSRQNNFLKIAGGVNYFLRGHQARIGAEFWHLKSGVNLDAANAVHQVLVQGQIYF